MPMDRSSVVKGMFIEGGTYPAIVKGRDHPPVSYGQPLKPPDLSEIARRLDAAKRRLEEIAAQVAEAKRR